MGEWPRAQKQGGFVRPENHGGGSVEHIRARTARHVQVYAVAGDGSVDFSFAGRIAIAELTSDEAARKLESVLEEKYFKDANVSISIANFVEGDLLVTGAVNGPGSLPFRGDSILTLMEAISRSGGLAENAAGDRVRILRWVPGGSMERQSIEVDVQAMLDTMDFQKTNTCGRGISSSCLTAAKRKGETNFWPWARWAGRASIPISEGWMLSRR